MISSLKLLGIIASTVVVAGDAVAPSVYVYTEKDRREDVRQNCLHEGGIRLEVRKGGQLVCIFPAASLQEYQRPQRMDVPYTPKQHRQPPLVGV
jgi:hypothetical protein